jgi:hypothetical protein
MNFIEFLVERYERVNIHFPHIQNMAMINYTPQIQSNQLGAAETEVSWVTSDEHNMVATASTSAVVTPHACHHVNSPTGTDASICAAQTKTEQRL